MTQTSNLSAVPELEPLEGGVFAAIKKLRDENPNITQEELLKALTPAKGAGTPRPETVLSVNVNGDRETLPKTGAGDTTGGIIALSHASYLGETFTRGELVAAMGRGVEDKDGVVIPGTKRRAGSAGWWVRELIKTGHLTKVG